MDAPLKITDGNVDKIPTVNEPFVVLPIAATLTIKLFVTPVVLINAPEPGPFASGSQTSVNVTVVVPIPATVVLSAKTPERDIVSPILILPVVPIPVCAIIVEPELIVPPNYCGSKSNNRR
jgi:hypothetical protein